mgnify:CR=1 FL=1
MGNRDKERELNSHWQYRSFIGLGFLFAIAVSPAQAASPSFDCAKAESSAEKLVCSDEQLAALDRETARLYGLAVKGPQVSGERKNHLKAYQRGWIKGRDECWKAPDKRACVRDSYAIRIYELRQGYADARSQDAKGISKGLLALECDGFDAGIGIAFISSDPSVAALGWKDQKIALEQVVSASGTKYAGKSFDGSYNLSTKGNEATFEMPEGKSFKCQIQTGG